MGRKKKPKAERVCAYVTFTCLPRELKAIKAAARKADKRLSPYCRAAILAAAEA